ncbi:MAG: hypothetical protein ACLGHX_04675 [Acidimicrobiia bacterium]
MQSVDALEPRLEVLAIAARLRSLGHPDTGDLVERWALTGTHLDIDDLAPIDPLGEGSGEQVDEAPGTGDRPQARRFERKA